MAGGYRIYISSTFEDLKAYREAVTHAIRKLDTSYTIICMEDYVASDSRPADECLRDVESCDIYIGIYAMRYGYIPPGEQRSITQMEHDMARDEKIPRFLFMLDENHAWPVKFVETGDGADRLKAFKEQIMQERMIDRFTTKESLATAVVQALARQYGTRKNPIPEILPYLSDRSEQSTTLRLALKQSTPAAQKRPYTLVVHGDEHESHSKFVERLEKHALPRLLQDIFGAQADHVIRRHNIPWPARKAKAAERQLLFEDELATRVAQNKAAGIPELMEEFRVPGRTTLIYSTVHYSAWNDNEPELIQNWLQFWQNLPAISDAGAVFASLCVEYRDRDKFGVLQKLGSDWRVNQSMLALTENLHEQADENLIVLPALSSVPFSDVSDWIDQHTAELCDEEQLRREARALFEKQKLQEIPMQDLAPQLQKLLTLARN